MKFLFWGILIMILSCIHVLPQVTEEWVARYNGIGDGKDNPIAMAVDSAGNVYVTGASIRSGTSNFDYATVKYDASGNQQWVALLNGANNSRDVPSGLALDGQGNIYVTGMITIAGINSDYATVKYNPGGTELWVSIFSGTGNSFDAATAIAVDQSGNAYVTGRTIPQGSVSSNYTTLRYSTTGVEQFVVDYDGPSSGEDIARGLVLDDNGFIYVTGTSLDNIGLFDYATLKYDPAGNQLWLQRYDGPGNDFDEAVDIKVDAALNIYVTGSSRATNMGNSEDITTINYDQGGVQLWVGRYDGPANDLDLASALAVDSAGNSYVCGSVTAANGFTDFATLKYSPGGDLEWAALFDGPQSLDDVATGIALDASGNVYVTGFVTGNNSMFDFATIKYTAAGVQHWVIFYDGPLGLVDKPASIVVNTSGNVYVTGSSSGTLIQNTDFVTIKYSQPTGIGSDEQLVPGKLALEQNYPNPFNPVTLIKYSIPKLSFVAIKVHDILGNEVATLINEEKPAGNYEVEFIATNLPTGIYFYRLQAGDFVETKKMLLLK